MEIPKIDFQKYSYPFKTLLLGNIDTWQSMLSVIEDLTPEQLQYKHQGIEQRCIAEMVVHTLDTQYGFYTKHLVLGESIPSTLYPELPQTADEATKMIVEAFGRTLTLWEKLSPEALNKEIKTEWGQVLTGELALFQSITHTHYHVSEICFLRGLGGFPTKVMG